MAEEKKGLFKRFFEKVSNWFSPDEDEDEYDEEYEEDAQEDGYPGPGPHSRRRRSVHHLIIPGDRSSPFSILHHRSPV